MPHKAEVRTTLLPGRKGTVRLYKEYGDQLICVRYRYDKLRPWRYRKNMETLAITWANKSQKSG